PAASEAALADEERQIKDIVRRDGGGRRVAEIRGDLGAAMDKYVAVFRDEDGLRQALDIVQRLKEEAKGASIDDKGTVFNQDVLGAIELGFMLDNAETTLVGAIERKESRGAQFRTDFPERDDEQWLKHIDLSLGEDGKAQVSYSPVTITQWQPEDRKY